MQSQPLTKEQQHVIDTLKKTMEYLEMLNIYVKAKVEEQKSNDKIK
jgi:hypothetical protein